MENLELKCLLEIHLSDEGFAISYNSCERMFYDRSMCHLFPTKHFLTIYKVQNRIVILSSSAARIESRPSIYLRALAYPQPTSMQSFTSPTPTSFTPTHLRVQPCTPTTPMRAAYSGEFQRKSNPLLSKISSPNGAMLGSNGRLNQSSAESSKLFMNPWGSQLLLPPPPPSCRPAN